MQWSFNIDKSLLIVNRSLSIISLVNKYIKKAMFISPNRRYRKINFEYYAKF